jgi:hypothetical protein
MRGMLFVAVVVLVVGPATAVMPAPSGEGTPGRSQASVAARQGDDRWRDFRFLLGQWAGVGKGSPGQGPGTFSFELALDDTVLLRRSHSTYPATKDRPAFSHDDLMVIYPEGVRVRAIYFDNENHVIHYTVSVSSAPRGLTFVSESVPDAPRFRFRYTTVDKDTVRSRFEIAPPGQPDAFSLYIEGDARRVP